jgi:VanZ family protein
VAATTHELEVQLTSHEAVCAERYQTFIQRVDRLESLIFKTAGALIVGMAGILVAILFKGI